MGSRPPFHEHLTVKTFSSPTSQNSICDFLILITDLEVFINQGELHGLTKTIAYFEQPLVNMRKWEPHMRSRSPTNLPKA